MMEDNPRPFLPPGWSPVGVDGRDRAEPENRPLFGRDEVLGITVLVVWGLLLDNELVSIVLTTP